MTTQPGAHRDFGHSRAVLDAGNLPVLGVCLGHQGIGLAAGARVVPAPRPRHGHLTRVSHASDGLFAGLPQGFTAVQFHSESICSERGARLLYGASKRAF